MIPNFNAQDGNNVEQINLVAEQSPKSVTASSEPRSPSKSTPRPTIPKQVVKTRRVPIRTRTQPRRIILLRFTKSANLSAFKTQKKNNLNDSEAQHTTPPPMGSLKQVRNRLRNRRLRIIHEILISVNCNR